MAERVTLSNEQRAALLDSMVKRMSEEEVRQLCFKLGVNHEILPHATLRDLARALIVYLEQRVRLGELLAHLRAHWPHVLADLPTPHSPTTPICHLPYPRNPNFTGREKLLADLRDALTAGETAALTQAITGLGGIGKTQTAVEYAYRHRDAYTLVWWADAAVPATLPAQFAQLADRLGLPEAGAQDQRLAVAAALRWLGEHDGWLLVLDNAERPEDVRPYLPRPQRGHVLVTSRYRAWGGLARAVETPPLPEAEAVQFLLKRTGQADEASATALAKELGGLPLALEQAGAYMERRRLPLAQYLTLYRGHHLALLEREKPSQDYPATVATTWALAFEQVEAAMPAAADLLRLCAFLAPDTIPLDMLVAGVEYLPERLRAGVADELALPDALGLLGDYSLVEVGQAEGGRQTAEGGTRPSAPTHHQAPTTVLAVHRLVQAVTRARLDAEATRTWAEAAVRVVYEAYPYVEYASWPDCERLLPHALRATELAEREGVAGEATGRLLNGVGVYLKARAQYGAARAALEGAVRLDEKIYPLAHPEVAIHLNNLGSLLRDQGDLPAARAHLERALRISEATVGSDHPTMAIRLNNLGSVLRDQGDLPAARAYYQRALSIWEGRLGQDHPQVAIGANNLGVVLRDLGDLPAARAHFERALRIWEERLGQDHPQVAIGANNLGNLLRDQGDLPAARAHLERALRIRQEKLGPDHPDVAQALNNLGNLLRDLRDLPAARAHFERALCIWEDRLGPDHPDVAQSLNNLGLVLHDLGEIPAARAHFERALRISEAKLGPDHPDVAQSLNKLGNLLRDLGDLPAARAHYQRALRILEATLGPDHPNTRIARRNLEALREQGIGNKDED